MDQDRVARVIDRLENVKASGRGYSARCPSHDDRVNSLSVAAGDKGGVVVHCHAGCPTANILAAVGLSMSDLAGAAYMETTYVYRSADGTPLWTVERWANPKTFRVVPALPDPAQRVIYNLPWVEYGIREKKTIYVVEGEKDVETLREYGHIGTCNVGGAGTGKWLPHYSDYLAGANVVVIADNDPAGIKHGRAVFHSVRSTAARVSLSRPLYGKDATELLRAGYPIEHTEPVPEDAPLASVLASSVQTSRVRWAWDRYFPMGSMSIVEGDPGDGKSTLTCDLVARWSTGARMPDGSNHAGPWRVMMISIEDDPSTTIVPRLRAAGADLEQVVLVIGGANPELPYNLGVDLDATERQVHQYNIKVIVLDPLMAFLPETTNGLVDAEVRRALAPLQQMARRLDIAIVVVRHLTKSATRALTAGSGGIGIIGAARAAFLVKPDPQDKAQRVMAPVKFNLTRRPAALGFFMEDDVDRGVGRVRWTGTKPIEDTDALFTDRSEDARDKEAAADWLEELLDNTYLQWDAIVKAAHKAGFNPRTLERARGDVAKCVTNPAIGGVISRGYYWYRKEQWPFEESRTVASPATLSLVKPPKLEKPNTESTAEDAMSDEVREEKLMAQERICDVCGSSRAVLFTKPYWVIRCRPHSPRTWKP